MSDGGIVKYSGPYVPVSQEMLDDVAGVRAQFEYAMEGVRLALAGTPRYGPPVPKPEPRYCETCGHELGFDWDDE